MKGSHLITHGYLRAGRKPAEYGPWCAMRRRCYDSAYKDYPHYGGRGISVCDRWRESFPAFLCDVGRRPTRNHTLERLDNNGNYVPGNVVWADRSAQSRNTRVTRYITWQGRTLGITDWADILGVKVNTLRTRIFQKHWTIEAAFTTPVTHTGRHR